MMSGNLSTYPTIVLIFNPLPEASTNVSTDTNAKLVVAAATVANGLKTLKSAQTELKQYFAEINQHLDKINVSMGKRKRPDYFLIGARSQHTRVRSS